MIANLNVFVYEFRASDASALVAVNSFNYKLYKRKVADSYRTGERQRIVDDLELWPNSPPVGIGHDFVQEGTNISNPLIISSLVEKESYYITIWKSGYEKINTSFYIDTTKFSGDLIVELQPIDPVNSTVFI